MDSLPVPIANHNTGTKVGTTKDHARAKKDLPKCRHRMTRGNRAAEKRQPYGYLKTKISV